MTSFFIVLNVLVFFLEFLACVEKFSGIILVIQAPFYPGVKSH